MKQLAIALSAAAALMLTACGQDAQAPKTEQAASAKSASATGPASRVLRAYRVDGMLEQSQGIITNSLLSNLPAAVGKDDQAKLKKAVDETYNKQALLSKTSKYLQQAAKKEGNEKYLKEAAKALESDLVQRMVDLDEKAATDEFAEAFAKFLDSEASDSSEERMQIVEGLADNLQLVDLQIAFNIGMMRGMIAARNAAAPEDYSMSQESADNMVTQTRDGLREHLGDQIPVMLFFAYQEMPDPKLQEYVSIQEREALQWVNKAMVDALGRAFSEAADTVSKRYRDLAGGASA